MTTHHPIRPQQLPLAFEHEPASGRDDLVVSDPVSAAAGIVDRWPDWPAPVVIIVGPAGSGKSHLAMVWQHRSGATALAAAGAEAGIVAAGQGPVLLEDADRQPLDETALFHVINQVRSAGTSLLITARSGPLNWGVALPDLLSRLKAATVVEIGPPDDAALTQILFKLFADRQVVVDDKLVGYIVSRMERSLEAAQAIVETIDRLALARGARISRGLAGEALSQLRDEGDVDTDA